MPGKIYRYLADDHARLDRLLRRVADSPERFESSVYAEFRAGLLKHIGMEERILLPAAQRLRGGERLPIAARLRLDHGALAALLVPSATPGIIAAIRTILAAHNAVEESPGGLYEICEQLVGAKSDEIFARLKSVPEVAMAPNNDGPGVVEATRRALAKAGYNLEDFVSP